ncbi:fimbria/pilus periplasmic chaperone [Enterobacter bugandensis]|nr:fimbria/pilus periplasmic chaperone [Enterobacter bugandensis]
MRRDGGEKAPFVITPPLFRLDGEQENIIHEE